MLASIVFVLALVVRVGVSWHYTTRAWPGDLAAEARVIIDEYDGAAGRLQQEFDEWAATQRENITRYRRSGSLSPEATDRAIERVESRVTQRQASLQSAKLEAAATRDAQLEELRARRQAAAGDVANLSALVMLMVGSLGGVLVHLRRSRKPSPEPTRAPRRR